ncbi:MAG: hypothetical protein IT423_11035 [Pirellulaceae bacterium]|nr:hypothetical protein [Pirellulaceae bacterium]
MLRRFSLSVLGLLVPLSVLSSPASPIALAQLQTLSRGNVDAQWRDAQVKEFDRPLADNQLPKELKQELQAQRDWLVKWNPKTNETASETNNQPNSQAKNLADAKTLPPLKEPPLDPSGLAGKLRVALFHGKTPPTLKDTSALQSALSEHSGDVGLRQLQLHWIDQMRYRNDYWKEISDASGRVISLLEKQKKPTDEMKAAMAFAHYRKARALAHALRGAKLPDSPVAGAAKLSDEEIQGYRDTVSESLAIVEQLVGPDHAEFFQLKIFTLRRDGWSGQALELLERNVDSIDQSAYLTEKLSLLEALKWQAPAKQVSTALAAIPTEQLRALEIQYVP